MATIGERKALWTGETGILTVLILVVVAVIVSCGPWAQPRTVPPASLATIARAEAARS